MKALVLMALATAGGAACGIPPGAIYVRESFVAPANITEVRWRLHLTEDPLIEYKPQEFASAASDGQRVFIGSSAGTFYALRADDGEVLWKHKTGGPIGGRPTYVGSVGLVFVGAGDGGLYALDARDGKERWVYRCKGPIDSEPVYADGVVYFTTGENRVYALDALTGRWKWQYDREPPESFTIRGYAAPLVVGARVYVGFSDGYLATLSASSGDVLWSRSLAGDASRFVDVDDT
jgi:outer membrane protein assembly factor BamB